jgi:hypothetical protein
MSLMNHARAREDMQLALDARLDGGRLTELEAHLAGCDRCRADWEALRALDGLLARAAVSPAPAGFGARALARLDARARAAEATMAPAPEEWRRALAGATLLAVGALALVTAIALPVLVSTGGLFGALLAPAQWPALLAGLQDWLHLLDTLARLGVAIGRAGEGLLRAYPGLLIVLLALLGLVALWTWTVQQLTESRPGGRLTGGLFIA